MNFEQLLEAMTPEIHARMRTAVEIGKWPDGRRLTDEEREASLQALIAWEARHLPEEERIGYIDRRKPDGRPHGPHRSTDDIIRVLNTDE